MPAMKMIYRGQKIEDIARMIESASNVVVDSITITSYKGDIFRDDTVTINYEPREPVDIEMDVLSVRMHEFHGWSSGAIALELGMHPEKVKRYMRDLEDEGEGTYSIQDGMFYFWYKDRREGGLL